MNDNDVKQLTKRLRTLADTLGLRLNTNQTVVSKIVASLLKRQEKTGFLRCPCQVAKSSSDRSCDCPCKQGIELAHDSGACHCCLFVKE